MQYGKFSPVLTVGECLLIHYFCSSPRKLWLEGVAYHPRMHVIRQPRVAELGAPRARSYQTYQVCVRRFVSAYYISSIFLTPSVLQI